ncbi:MAG: Mur ligase family protein [Candidatus Levybacteria bacterium]|nr:Mur ligase family protein [Candidatus Levybacteria bacterium]
MAKILVGIGKLISSVSRLLNLGHGSTWPGHVALLLNPKFIRQVLKNSRLKVILIAGTNGKTTTGKLIKTILEKAGYSVFQNEAGANLLNGIASTLIQNSTGLGKIEQDFAIFELDENSLPLLLNEITPDYLLLLNLFRDQLDRYGEVDTISRKWRKAIEQLSNGTILILNADDPQIAYLQTDFKGKVLFFGLNDKSASTKSHQHAVDSVYCLNCGSKLTYKTIYFSHLGDWKCTNCSLARPGLAEAFSFYPLSGVYNKYNTLAAVLLCRTIGIDSKTINSALHEFSPAFGRQEILSVDGKNIQIFLSKNPTSFNESLRTVKKLKGKNILLVLNDRIPDGRDVSWIWDVDFENYISKIKHIFISGDKAYDMALRIKYAQISFEVDGNLQKVMHKAIAQTYPTETLYILPTYSAMLEVRKILTGKKIL